MINVTLTHCLIGDIASNTQPESAGPIWNLRGVLNNAWHAVTVNDPSAGKKAEAAVKAPQQPKM